VSTPSTSLFCNNSKREYLSNDQRQFDFFRVKIHFVAANLRWLEDLPLTNPSFERSALWAENKKVQVKDEYFGFRCVAAEKKAKQPAGTAGPP